MNNLIQVKDLCFASIEFYETFIVCKIKEGIVLDLPKTVSLHEESRSFYNGLKYGFIFDRTIDFTIDPLVYLQCPYYPDINALFVVANTFQTREIVRFEQKFSDYKIKTFFCLDSAMKAMKTIQFGDKSSFSYCTSQVRLKVE